MGSASEECSNNVYLPSKVLRLAPVTCIDHYHYYLQIYPTTNTSGLVCLNVITSFITYIFPLLPVTSFFAVYLC